MADRPTYPYDQPLQGNGFSAPSNPYDQYRQFDNPTSPSPVSTGHNSQTPQNGYNTSGRRGADEVIIGRYGYQEQLPAYNAYPPAAPSAQGTPAPTYQSPPSHVSASRGSNAPSYQQQPYQSYPSSDPAITDTLRALGGPGGHPAPFDPQALAAQGRRAGYAGMQPGGQGHSTSHRHHTSTSRSQAPSAPSQPRDSHRSSRHSTHHSSSGGRTR
ncbi:hypothetical protein ACWGJ2_25140 [Streptomyces sp. NPDC054796]